MQARHRRRCVGRAHGVSVVTIQSRALSKADFATSAKANPKPIVPVTDLGTPAYFAANFILLTWKHGTEVTFTVSGAGGSPLAAEKALAKKALARL